MKHKMRKLKARMYECDVKSFEIAEKLGKSYSYVSSRICCKCSFTTNDAHIIMRMLDIPAEQMSIYFPPLPQKEA